MSAEPGVVKRRALTGRTAVVGSFGFCASRGTPPSPGLRPTSPRGGEVLKTKRPFPYRFYVAIAISKRGEGERLLPSRGKAIGALAFHLRHLAPFGERSAEGRVRGRPPQSATKAGDAGTALEVGQVQLFITPGSRWGDETTDSHEPEGRRGVSHFWCAPGWFPPHPAAGRPLPGGARC